MTGFTPEELRTAARVARRSIFTEGRPDLADVWDKAADQAEARLIPAGGMALTAEQVEDVRTVVSADAAAWNRLSPALFAAYRLRRALFPATEPAEDAKPCGSNSVTLGWCKLTARHEGLHTNGTYLWGTPSEPDPPAPSEPAEERCQSVSIFRERCALVPGHDGRHAANGCAWGYPPAPAVPAEEETKAEDYASVARREALGRVAQQLYEQSFDGCDGTFYHDFGRALEDFLPSQGWTRIPASSPVVPAPTETEAGHA